TTSHPSTAALTSSVLRGGGLQGVGNGSLSQSVLDDRVSDLLRVKTLLGLFDDPYTPTDWVDQFVNSPAHQQLALDGTHTHTQSLARSVSRHRLTFVVPLHPLIYSCSSGPGIASEQRQFSSIELGDCSGGGSTGNVCVSAGYSGLQRRRGK